MELHLSGFREDSEYNGIGFLKISNISEMQNVFFDEKVQFNRGHDTWLMISPDLEYGGQFWSICLPYSVPNTPQQIILNERHKGATAVANNRQ